MLNGLTETTVEPLTINDIKMFESLDLDSSGSSGIGNSNEAIIEGSLDETDSLLEDASQHCKICKWVEDNLLIIEVHHTHFYFVL